MKFLTADIYRRFRSLDDDIADAADLEWEEAAQRLREYEKTIHFPFPVLKGEEFYLHDAEILEFGGETMILRPENQSGVWQLTFHGADIKPIGCKLWFDQSEIDKEGDIYIFRVLLSCNNGNYFTSGGKDGKQTVEVLRPCGDGHEVDIYFKNLSVNRDL